MATILLLQSECRATIDKNLEKFGVVCHGNLSIHSLAFKYRSELESRLFCSDMLIQVNFQRESFTRVLPFLLRYAYLGTFQRYSFTRVPPFLLRYAHPGKLSKGQFHESPAFSAQICSSRYLSMVQFHERVHLTFLHYSLFFLSGDAIMYILTQ